MGAAARRRSGRRSFKKVFSSCSSPFNPASPESFPSNLDDSQSVRMPVL